MTRRPPASFRSGRPSPAAPAPSDSAGTPPGGSPDVPAESQKPVSSAASADSTATLLLVTTNPAFAERLKTDVRCWLVGPETGMGEVRVQVAVDPTLRDTPDATWLAAQLELKNIGQLIPATIIWGPTDD